MNFWCLYSHHKFAKATVLMMKAFHFIFCIEQLCFKKFVSFLHFIGPIYRIISLTIKITCPLYLITEVPSIIS